MPCAKATPVLFALLLLPALVTPSSKTVTGHALNGWITSEWQQRRHDGSPNKFIKDQKMMAIVDPLGVLHRQDGVGDAVDGDKTAPYNSELMSSTEEVWSFLLKRSVANERRKRMVGVVDPEDSPSEQNRRKREIGITDPNDRSEDDSRRKRMVGIVDPGERSEQEGRRKRGVWAIDGKKKRSLRVDAQDGRRKKRTFVIGDPLTGGLKRKRKRMVGIVDPVDGRSEQDGRRKKRTLVIGDPDGGRSEEVERRKRMVGIVEPDGRQRRQSEKKRSIDIVDIDRGRSGENWNRSGGVGIGDPAGKHRSRRVTVTDPESERK